MTIDAENITIIEVKQLLRRYSVNATGKKQVLLERIAALRDYFLSVKERLNPITLSSTTNGTIHSSCSHKGPASILLESSVYGHSNATIASSNQEGPMCREAEEAAALCRMAISEATSGPIMSVLGCGSVSSLNQENNSGPVSLGIKSNASTMSDEKTDDDSRASVQAILSMHHSLPVLTTTI
jgi:hypothetical protein